MDASASYTKKGGAANSNSQTEAKEGGVSTGMCDTKKEAACKSAARAMGTVKLISAEGVEFIVDLEVAMVSKLLRRMFASDGRFTEKETREVRFPHIRTPILLKVVDYCYFHLEAVAGRVKESDFPIDPEIALELLHATHYLEV